MSRSALPRYGTGGILDAHRHAPGRAPGRDRDYSRMIKLSRTSAVPRAAMSVMTTHVFGKRATVDPVEQVLSTPSSYSFHGTGRVSAWSGEFDETITKLGGLRQGWDGDIALPPDATSRSLARNVLTRLVEADIRPARLVATREGGLGFIFFGSRKLPGGAHERYASISVANGGEMIETRVERPSLRSRSQSIPCDDESIDEAIHRIQGFLAQ